MDLLAPPAPPADPLAPPAPPEMPPMPGMPALEEATADPLLAPAADPLAISIEQTKADPFTSPLMLFKLELQEQKFVMPPRLIKLKVTS